MQKMISFTKMYLLTTATATATTASYKSMLSRKKKIRRVFFQFFECFLLFVSSFAFLLLCFVARVWSSFCRYFGIPVSHCLCSVWYHLFIYSFIYSSIFIHTHTYTCYECRYVFLFFFCCSVAISVSFGWLLSLSLGYALVLSMACIEHIFFFSEQSRSYFFCRFFSLPVLLWKLYFSFSCCSLIQSGQQITDEIVAFYGFRLMMKCCFSSLSLDLRLLLTQSQTKKKLISLYFDQCENFLLKIFFFSLHKLSKFDFGRN